jgi:phage portal protein BeeE
MATRDGEPRVYRVGIPEASGGRTETLLAAEVLHLRIGADAATPWAGQAPLRRAAISAGLLHELESALRETFTDAPLGSQILSLDMGGGEGWERMRGALRGRRGASLFVEYLTHAIASGVPAPKRDGATSLSPILRDSMTVEHLEQARGAILMAFGVLPAMLNPAATGPVIREGQRHLATWALQPIAELIAEEAGAKLGAAVSIDVHRPLQSFDAGGSARAAAGMMQALATAKEAGLSDAHVAAAFGALDWKEALPR